jgi:hypothetical protein
MTHVAPLTHFSLRRANREHNINGARIDIRTTTKIEAKDEPRIQLVQLPYYSMVHIAILAVRLFPGSAKVVPVRRLITERLYTDKTLEESNGQLYTL